VETPGHRRKLLGSPRNTPLSPPVATASPRNNRSSLSLSLSLSCARARNPLASYRGWINPFFYVARRELQNARFGPLLTLNTDAQRWAKLRSFLSPSSPPLLPPTESLKTWGLPP